MKFVWCPDINRFRRTETEAKKEKLRYEVVELETDKDSLIALFNGYEERVQQLLEGHTAAPQPADEHEPEPTPSVTPPPPPAAPAQPPSADGPKKTIQEVILDMGPEKLAPLVEGAVSRLGELGDKGFDALEGQMDFQGVGASFSRGVHILSIVAMGQHQLARIMRRQKQAKA